MSGNVAQPNEVRSADVDAVARRLSSLEVGEWLEWTELEAQLQKPRDYVRSVVRDARRKLMREEMMHFETVRGEGVERVDEKHMATEGMTKRVRRIRSAASKAADTARHVKIEGLSLSEQSNVVATQTLAMFVSESCSKKRMNALRSDLEKEKICRPLTFAEASKRLLKK